MNLLFQKRPPASLIGLKLERTRLEGVLLRRRGDGLQIVRTMQASLSLDPLTNDPELVGRELRNHLNEAGLKERRCAVCVPLNWTLTLQTKLPDLPEADVASFLEIEAEKGFPYPLEDLCISSSRYRTPGGEQHATIVAMPRNHVTLLQRALKAADLRPISFSLAVSALQQALSESAVRGSLSMLVGENTIELQVSSRGGIVALRSLEGTIETRGNQKEIDSDQIAREIKITLGQLPRSLCENLRNLEVFGRPEMTQPFLKEIGPRLEGLGLKVSPGAVQQINGFEIPLPPDKSVSPALNTAALFMLGHAAPFEFLPPKVSAVPQVLARFASRKYLSAGAASGALAVVAAGAFLVQHWQLASVQARWKEMEPRAAQLETLQQQIRKFRPWYDESPRTLAILRQVTEAFPEDSSVTAKTIEIRSGDVITCTGTTQSTQALQQMMDRLRASKAVQDLQYDRLRGSVFSINFRWVEEGAND